MEKSDETGPKSSGPVGLHQESHLGGVDGGETGGAAKDDGDGGGGEGGGGRSLHSEQYMQRAQVQDISQPASYGHWALHGGGLRGRGAAGSGGGAVG